LWILTNSSGRNNIIHTKPLTENCRAGEILNLVYEVSVTLTPTSDNTLQIQTLMNRSKNPKYNFSRLTVPTDRRTAYPNQAVLTPGT
jgi:hypothetical protein